MSAASSPIGILAVLAWAVVLAIGQRPACADAYFWLSLDPNSGGTVPARLEEKAFVPPGGSNTMELYVWAKLVEPTGPIGNLTNISLNIRSENVVPGTDVVDFESVRVDNPELGSSGGTEYRRYQFARDSTDPAVDPGPDDPFSLCFDDPFGTTQCPDPVAAESEPEDTFDKSFGGISVDMPFSGRVGVGIGQQATTFADPTFDGSSWRIATISVRLLNPGAARLFLSIGEPGISENGQSPSDTTVIFGDTTEMPLAGDTIFAESIDEDALLTVHLMPDYDRRGVVDAADYTVWRDTRGSMSDLRADGNGNGLVDQMDYDIWKSHFAAVSSGTSHALEVPEPEAAGWLAALGGLLGMVRLRGRR